MINLHKKLIIEFMTYVIERYNEKGIVKDSVNPVIIDNIPYVHLMGYRGLAVKELVSSNLIRRYTGNLKHIYKNYYTFNPLRFRGSNLLTRF